jgi:Zn-dependent peptidase ImmA (M78 family)
MSRRLTPEKLASQILEEIGIEEPPIPVELIAYRRGLRVDPFDLGDDVSGVLVISDGKGVIGYNSTHSLARRRFTIAHECGHYEMHRDDGQLFIDKRYIDKQYFIAFRDGRSSTGEDKQEREANAFAAALLMPENILQREIEKRYFDLADESTLDDLAELFQVSQQAMMYRLLNLGILQIST